MDRKILKRDRPTGGAEKISNPDSPSTMTWKRCDEIVGFNGFIFLYGMLFFEDDKKWTTQIVVINTFCVSIFAFLTYYNHLPLVFYRFDVFFALSGLVIGCIASFHEDMIIGSLSLFGVLFWYTLSAVAKEYQNCWLQTLGHMWFRFLVFMPMYLIHWGDLRHKESWRAWSVPALFVVYNVAELWFHDTQQIWKSWVPVNVWGCLAYAIYVTRNPVTNLDAIWFAFPLFCVGHIGFGLLYLLGYLEKTDNDGWQRVTSSFPFTKPAPKSKSV